MTDSENDNLENNDDDLEEDDGYLEDDDENENDEEDKFKYYDFDNNEMYTMYLKNSKIDKVKDYYDLFVSMLKTEDKNLHTREHFALRPFREGFGYRQS